MRVSVVIPCLNEENLLPGLIGALREQTLPPYEIIVADAGSTDHTVTLAEQAGGKVVPGGRPAAGRNAGARMASGDLLLFLDADVQPPPVFLELMLKEFTVRGLAVATCLVEPISEHSSDWLISDITNLYLQMIQYVSPHAPGFCILVRRDIHQAIGGYDESVVMAEDHDYVQRAAHLGSFGVLTGVRIPVSVRRLEKEGMVRLAVKYLYCELYALAGRPIRSIPFVYEFGDYGKAQARRFIDVTWLRQKFGSLENPLHSLSERSKSSLQDLGSFQLSSEAFHRVLHSLLPGELALLRRYLRQRMLGISSGEARLRSQLKIIQSSRPFHHIPRLDIDWRSIFQSSALSDDEEQAKIPGGKPPKENL